MRYLVPFSYMFTTRYKTLAYKIAFMIVYLCPLIIIAWINKADIRLFLASVIGVNCIYENGYIDNDLITIDWEEKPTVRVNHSKQERLKRNYLLMKSFRDMGYLLSVLAVYIICPARLSVFLLSGTVLVVVYSIHNTIRSIWNTVTFSFLVLLKYAIPIICMLDKMLEIFLGLLSVIVLICIPRIFEYALKYGNHGKQYMDQLERNRFIYYLIMSFLAIFLYNLNIKSFPFLVLSDYYLIFRGGVYLMKNTKTQLKKNEERSGVQ